MVSLTLLWLPILVSAVLVFIASSIIHMTPLWHRSDFPKLAREDEVRAALQPLALPPGDYFVPRAGGMEEMRSDAFKEKMRTGPVIVMTVLPNGPIEMGRNLGQWFAYVIVVSAFVALVCSRTLAQGAGYPHVFKVAGALAFMGYVLALPQLSIWYRRGWDLVLKAAFDGVFYAALTAGAFGWLWPR